MSQSVTVRLEDDLVAAIDELATSQQRSRTGQIAYMLNVAMQFSPSPSKATLDAVSNVTTKSKRGKATVSKSVTVAKPCSHGLAYHPGCTD